MSLLDVPPPTSEGMEPARLALATFCVQSRRSSKFELRPRDSDDELVGEMFLRALSNELPPDESGGQDSNLLLDLRKM